MGCKVFRFLFYVAQLMGKNLVGCMGTVSMGIFFYLYNGNISLLFVGFPFICWALNVVAPFSGFPLVLPGCLFFFTSYTVACVFQWVLPLFSLGDFLSGPSFVPGAHQFSMGFVFIPRANFGNEVSFFYHV